MTLEADEGYMRRALKEAAKAAERGEVPVGAVLVDATGRIIARGSNAPIGKNDPTAHAEIIALRKAAKRARNYRLVGTTLYVTIEPCAMCLGAIVHARLRRLVYGADDPKAGAVHSIVRLPIEKTNHRLEIEGGILADECGRALKDFFAAKRRRSL
jgi:tRNA(adenine34) deaminase